jgi:hypothetical protein
MTSLFNTQQQNAIDIKILSPSIKIYNNNLSTTDTPHKNNFHVGDNAHQLNYNPLTFYFNTKTAN